MVVLCKVVAVGVNDQYLLSRLENSLWLWCIFLCNYLANIMSCCVVQGPRSLGFIFG